MTSPLRPPTFRPIPTCGRGHGQTPQTAEQVALGRLAGAELATHLVERVRRTGLPAERASTQSVPQIYDIVIRGYIFSVSEGSTAKRVAIGFGAGAAELGVAVEGFR